MSVDVPLEDSPLVRAVRLLHPDSIAPAERPSVSLHLLVKNGASCLGRLLGNVEPYLDEIVAVLNDCTDETAEILQSYARLRGPGFRLEIVEMTSASHPQFYILDVPETYAVGTPLAGETLKGPHTGKPLLADWAAARNLGWQRCTKQWILFLDADDVVLDPECIPGLCLALDGKDASLGGSKFDLANSRYIYGVTEEGRARADSFRERLARNAPYIKWSGITHEILQGQQGTIQVDGNLVVRDMKDSTGEGVRVPGRCLKVLYQNARVNDWVVSPRNLLYLAMEARATMPDFALVVLDQYLMLSLWPEERAWACCMAGEIHEGRGDYAKASEWYERALAEHPGSKSAFRLCRSRFREERWQDAVAAFGAGVENKEVLQLIDDGPVYEDMSKILVAGALAKLGRPAEALAMCGDALRAFPQNPALVAMRGQLQREVKSKR